MDTRNWKYCIDMQIENILQAHCAFTVPRYPRFLRTFSAVGSVQSRDKQNITCKLRHLYDIKDVYHVI